MTQQVLLALVVVLAVALMISVWRLAHKPRPARRPAESSERAPRPRYVRGEMCDARMQPLEERLERLDGKDGAIEALWNTMREEDTKTRESLGKITRDFEGAISRLDGTMGQINQTMQVILKSKLES